MSKKKTCARCDQPYPATTKYFYRVNSKSNALHAYCKPCALEYNRAWRSKDPSRIEAIRQRSKRYGRTHKFERAVYMKAYYQRLKQTVVDHYGGRCRCCDVAQLVYLVIDHVNGGGNAHRRAIKKSTGTAFYLWLIRSHFPNGFQVLCHNCNFAKSNGGCVGANHHLAPT